MNLLRKYYDKDSIGGGIPDDVRKKIDKLEERRYIEDSYPDEMRTIILKGVALFGYSLATEVKLKNKNLI